MPDDLSAIDELAPLTVCYVHFCGESVWSPSNRAGVQLGELATTLGAAAVDPQMEPAAEGLRADVQAVVVQLLAGEGGPKVGVALPVGTQDSPFEGRIGLVVGGAAAQAVDESGIAAGLELALQASHLAYGEVKQAGRLGLSSFVAQDGVHDLEDIAFSLTHEYPVGGWHVDRHGSSLAWARRTFLSR